MLKYILFVLSGYYSEIVRKRRDELEENIRGQATGPEILIKKIPAGSFAAQEESTALPEADPQSTLLITDCAHAAGYYREAGWYVAVLYHDGNRQEPFPAVRYGIEDLFALERSAFEEVYRRLACLPWRLSGFRWGRAPSRMSRTFTGSIRIRPSPDTWKICSRRRRRSRRT